LGEHAGEDNVDGQQVQYLSGDRKPLYVLYADAQELQDHQQRLQAIDKASESGCVWMQMEQPAQQSS